MKKTNKSIAKGMFLALAVTLGFTSCSKDNGSGPELEKEPEMRSVIHIVGQDFESNSAQYWKDGELTRLETKETHSHAREIFANGNDIYVLGGNEIGPTYWKNGAMADLSEMYEKRYPLALTVSGNDIYMTGYQNEADKQDVPIFWKNNETPVKLELIENAIYVNLRGIAVVGTKCYVVGIVYFNNNSAKLVLWENGKARHITDGTNSVNVYRIVATNEEVFLIGDEFIEGFYTPTIWDKDGKADRYEGDVELSNVTRIGNDKYIVGSEHINNKPQAVYWKNGQKIWSSNLDSYSEGFGIAVDGEDIYISGVSDDKPTLWKNGVASSLGTRPGVALGILITKEPVEQEKSK